MDEESLAAEFRRLRDSKSKLRRNHASFFEAGRDYQGIMEMELARELARYLVASGSMEIEEVRRGEDPPDCIFILADGKKFAVEVTELVNRVAIEAQVKKDHSVYGRELFDWDQNNTHDRIMERLEAKSKSAIKYHADYDQSIVLMYTDEMMLHGGVLSRYVNGYEWPQYRGVDQAYVLQSYEPGRGYPVEILFTR